MRDALVRSDGGRLPDLPPSLLAFLDGLAELIAEAILNEVREGVQILPIFQRLQTYPHRLDPNAGYPCGEHESQPKEVLH